MKLLESMGWIHLVEISRIGNTRYPGLWRTAVRVVQMQKGESESRSAYLAAYWATAIMHVKPIMVGFQPQKNLSKNLHLALLMGANEMNGLAEFRTVSSEKLKTMRDELAGIEDLEGYTAFFMRNFPRAN